MGTKLLYSLLAAMMAFGLYAQQAVVTGRVQSAGVPVEFASVGVKGTSIGSVTGEDGTFEIRNIAYGTHALEISRVGYQTTTRTIHVNTPRISLSLELKEEVGTLAEVVITGTMKEVGKLASPIPVEIYSPVLLKKNPTPNIFESLNIINGVQPQINCNVCNTGDIHINGLEGSYTMVLIDGMPIVSSLSTVYGLSGIPNNLVRRIEVVKGPASTLYGSEAVGGLINIITKDPLLVPSVQVDVFATSVGELNTDISLRKKIGKATALLGVNSFFYNQLRDINADNFTDVPVQNRISLFNKWSLPLRSGKNSTVAWRYFYEDRWGGELQWTAQYRGSDIYYGESVFTNRWEVIGTHPLSGAQDIALDYSYNYHKQDSYYGTVKFLASQHVAFAQVRWSKKTGVHDWLMGVPLRYIYYDDNTPGTGELSGANTPSITLLPGVFVQDEISVGPGIAALAGLRYDHHNIHGGILTPRFSLKFSPSATSVIRLTGGSGYRVVNLFTEDHAALTGSREVVIVNELKPEQSWNVNLNYSRNIPLTSGFVNLDGSLFYTYFNNKIVGDFLTDPDKILYDNLDGHAISRGLTLNADLQLSSGWSAMAGVTWMDVFSVDKTSGSEQKVPQLFAPRLSGTLSVSYAPDNSKWLFDLTGRFNGSMYLPVLKDDFRPEESPLVPLLNLQVTRTVASANGKNEWEIYGGVKNILNFVPDNPLMHPDDPFDRPGGKYFDENGNPRPDTNPHGYTFDTAYNYAPIQGLRAFLGLRYTFR